MGQLTKLGKDSHQEELPRPTTDARDRSMASPATPNVPREHAPMRLIPWPDIWTSLKVAKLRGNGKMIEVFYDTLFKEAVFDDHGAWSLNLRKRN